MSAMAHDRSRRHGKASVEVTPPEVREEVRRRLGALEAHIGSRSRHAGDDTRELLIAPAPHTVETPRVVDAQTVADAIARLRLLEISVRNRERHP